MEPEKNWRNQSIEMLEKYNYGDPLTAPTALVSKCLAYVKIPVGSLSAEQLRLLIGQEIGLPYLIPLALEHLDKDILAEGDLYEGDLLENVTTVDVKFWQAHPDLYASLKKCIKKGEQKITQYGIDVSNFPNL